jgi:hypothetical protein
VICLVDFWNEGLCESPRSPGGSSHVPPAVAASRLLGPGWRLDVLCPVSRRPRSTGRPLPVSPPGERSILLFTSGDGVFEFGGTFDKGERLLTFNLPDARVVLPTIDVSGPDKTAVSVVAPGAQAALAAYPVDLGKAVSRTDLLTQLRGAKVNLPTNQIVAARAGWEYPPADKGQNPTCTVKVMNTTGKRLPKGQWVFLSDGKVVSQNSPQDELAPTTPPTFALAIFALAPPRTVADLSLALRVAPSTPDPRLAVKSTFSDTAITVTQKATAGGLPSVRKIANGAIYSRDRRSTASSIKTSYPADSLNNFATQGLPLTLKYPRDANWSLLSLPMQPGKDGTYGFQLSLADQAAFTVSEERSTTLSDPLLPATADTIARRPEAYPLADREYWREQARFSIFALEEGLLPRLDGGEVITAYGQPIDPAPIRRMLQRAKNLLERVPA